MFALSTTLYPEIILLKKVIFLCFVQLGLTTKVETQEVENSTCFQNSSPISSAIRIGRIAAGYELGLQKTTVFSNALPSDRRHSLSYRVIRSYKVGIWRKLKKWRAYFSLIGNWRQGKVERIGAARMKRPIKKWGWGKHKEEQGGRRALQKQINVFLVYPAFFLIFFAKRRRKKAIVKSLQPKTLLHSG